MPITRDAGATCRVEHSALPSLSSTEPLFFSGRAEAACSRSPRFPFRRTTLFSVAVSRRCRSSVATLLLASSLTLGGCRATGRAANAYFDWGGRTFTTNPVSVAPFFVGFVLFFGAFLPLDIFSAIAAGLGWPEGQGEDFQSCALAPSVFMGTTGGVILAAPFFPFGLPWWNPDGEDAEATAPKAEPASEEPRNPPAKDRARTDETPPIVGPDPGDTPAGSPH